MLDAACLPQAGMLDVCVMRVMSVISGSSVRIIGQDLLLGLEALFFVRSLVGFTGLYSGVFPRCAGTEAL